MFAGFNLETDTDFNDFYEIGQETFKNNKDQVKDSLEKFIDSDGSIAGTELQSYWFPQIEADIFISHSHKDQNQAIGLAGWLKKTFDLNVFIDSCVWGYAGNLLKMIDEKYCKNEDKKTYDYNKRNNSTSHVHMILSTALTMMIDKSECLIFLNTPNAINSTAELIQTESAWIYHELAMTNLVRKKKLEEYRKGILKKAMFESAAQKSLKIKYDISFDSLHSINQEDLNLWKASLGFRSEDYALDILYKRKNIIK